MKNKEELLIQELKEELELKTNKYDDKLRLIISEVQKYYPIDMRSSVRPEEIRAILRIANLFF